jgi:putative transposase
MPSKNSIKDFAADQMWHVYNRSSFGRNLFLDEQDYKVLLSYFKVCLTAERPSKETLHTMPYLANIIRLRRLNLYKEVELVSYCLMPNHYHLLLYQYTPDGISKLMRSVMTGYSMYYNRRHNSYGHLFQGTYKASLIANDSYWLHISRYIHLNPMDIKQDYKDYEYSSYKYFINRPAPTWLHPEHITGAFSKKEYESFVSEYIYNKEVVNEIKHILADQ